MDTTHIISAMMPNKIKSKFQVLSPILKFLMLITSFFSFTCGLPNLALVFTQFRECFTSFTPSSGTFASFIPLNFSERSVRRVSAVTYTSVLHHGCPPCIFCSRLNLFASLSQTYPRTCKQLFGRTKNMMQRVCMSENHKEKTMSD